MSPAADGRTQRWRASLHLQGGRLLAFVLFCTLIVLLALAGDDGRELLRYERLAIQQGEWWRLVSGHLVHLDLGHSALNLMGFALMWALFLPDFSVRRWLLILAAALVAIDIGFYFINTGLVWYVGLSGVLHGVMAAGTIAHVRRREADAWVLVPFLVGKLIWEQSAGAMPYSGDSGPVVVDAHLYGALGAGAVALFLRPRSQPL